MNVSSRLVSAAVRNASARLPAWRLMSTTAQEDIRTKLTSELKISMKAKNTTATTTLRSVLSEVYSADKSTKDGEKVGNSVIVGILRKNVQRRAESATQFTAASRPDLAEKETQEAEILSSFLPPLLSEADIDRALKEIIETEQISLADGKRALGLVFKAFYAKVGKENVDADLVKLRAERLLA